MPKEDSVENTHEYNEASQLRTRCVILESQLDMAKVREEHLEMENKRLTKLVDTLTKTMMESQR